MPEPHETQLWAIAIKGDQSQTDLKAATEDFASCYAFKVPGSELRVGTLDSLMSLSDDLAKMDIVAEATVTKVHKQLTDLMPSETPTIEGVPVVAFTTRQWEWNEAKFQLKAPLRELAETISLRISGVDDELKLKVGEMNAVKGALQAIERKTQGNLMVRGLTDIVDEADVMESEHMTTVFVVVPKANMKDFLEYYEKMATYVVPKSALLLNEDMEYGLYRVVIFKKSLDEFKANAREKRLTLRDFTYDPNALEADRMKKAADQAAYGDLKQKLSTWCHISYTESYSNLLHLKAVRVFVESVLRYGLTNSYNKGMVPNFKSFLLVPKKGKSENLRKALAGLYTSAAALLGEGEEETVVPGATGEFYPYVYVPIETEPQVAT